MFHNITALRAMKDLIVEHILFLEVDLIVGLDSRGFLFGPIICMELGKPFLPIRKKGKLPGKVTQQKYTLEYGEVCLKILRNVLTVQKLFSPYIMYTTQFYSIFAGHI